MSISLLMIICIAVLSSIIAFVSSYKEYVDGRSKGLKGIKLRGKISIILSIAVIICSFIQYQSNLLDAEQKEKEVNRKASIHDSVLKEQYDSSLNYMQVKFDSSNIKTVTTIGEILAKQGFELDAANKTLKKYIKDSTNTTQQDPILALYPEQEIWISIDSTDIDRFHCHVRFISEDASSTGYNVSAAILLKGKSDIVFCVGREKLLFDDASISTMTFLERGFYFSQRLFYSAMYLHIKGTYKNTQRTKEYKIDELYEYDPSIKKTKGVVGDLKEYVYKIENNKCP